MKAERLHSVAAAVLSETTGNQIPEKIETLAAILQATLANPAAANVQAMNQAREALRDALASSATNSSPASWRELIAESRIDHLVGTGLWHDIEKRLGSNSLELAGVPAQLRETAQAVSALTQHTQALIHALDYYEVQTEASEPGGFSFGVQIPRDDIASSFDEFIREARDINYIVRVFSEVATGTTGETTLASLSSSDYFISLIPASVTIVAVLAKSINWLLDAYQKVQNIKKTTAELKGLKAPQQVQETIEQWAEEVMKEEVKRQVASFAADYISKNTQDAGRRRELEIALEHAINMIANRIDRGFGFEVRALPPSPVTDEAPLGDETKSTSMTADEMLHYRTIVEIAAAMRLTNSSGNSVLSLPEPSSSEVEKLAPVASPSDEVRNTETAGEPSAAKRKTRRKKASPDNR